MQAYTGFVYGGPLWPRRVNRGLARRAREAGLSGVRDAVGGGAADDPAANPSRPATAPPAA